MGIFEQLKAHRLQLARLQFKNADDVTEGYTLMQPEEVPLTDVAIEDIEIERASLITILMVTVKNEVDFLFNNRITGLRETKRQF